MQDNHNSKLRFQDTKSELTLK